MNVLQFKMDTILSSFYMQSRYLMQIGEQQYPIEQSILFLLLILVLIFNIFLFARNHGTYTIKYQLMRNNRYFRVNQFVTNIIDILYKSFFVLPFIIIAAIAILRATRQPLQVLPILVNGLIVILIIYPTYRQSYYIKHAFIWAFAVASQFFSLFLKDPNPNSTSIFMELSFIFYTANSMVFCLALLFNQNVYWQLGQAIQLCDSDLISKVNQNWLKKGQNQLPQIFSGGLYGWMYRNSSFKRFLGIYIFSLCILGVYAFLIYHIENSYLGITGLITCIVYDIFILIFSSLRSKQRSIKNLFFMIYAGRLLSFIFGQNYWLFGYCVLYFFVGIFIGNIIIERHFPLKVQKKQEQKKKINALKTPEFVLLILTFEIIILILVQELAKVTQITKISFNQRQIPLWQFAILIVLATWVVILFLASGRLLSRHINRIKSLVQYYFGFASVTQYHIYLLLTYVLIVAGGIYCLAYLNDKNIFLACIFLPFVYLFLFQIGAAWIKNGYSILADTEDYNKKQYKKFQIKRKKKQMIEYRRNRQQNAKKLKIKGQNNQINMLQTGMIRTFNNDDIQFQTMDKFQHSSKKLFPQTQQMKQTKNVKQFQTEFPQKNDAFMQQNQSVQHQSNLNFNPFKQVTMVPSKQKYQTQQDFIQLKNWRQNKNLTYSQIWDNLTKNDKTILSSSAITLLILVIYSIVAGFWANHISGLAFSLSIISLMSSFIYYKFTMSGDNYMVIQLVIAISGFLLGLIFWSFLYTIPFGGIIWALLFIILSAITLQTGIEKNIKIQLIVMIAIQIVLLLGFICVILGVAYSLAAGIVSLAIVIICLLGILNFYMLQKNTHIPKFLKYGTIVFIAAVIILLAVIGFITDILSDFQVYTVIMLFIIAGFFIVYFIILVTKQSKKVTHPHIYSAYGLPIYRFQSQNQKLKTSANHVIIFEVSMILLVVYCSITTLFFKEKFYSIYGFSVFLIVQFTQMIFRSIQTYYFFGKNKKQISKKIVSNAFKTVMEKYMPDQTQGQDSPYYIELFEKAKQQAQKATGQQQLDQLWSKAVQLKYQVVKNLQQEQKFLFFWLALIRFYLYSQKQNKMNEYLILVQQIKQQLSQVGIVIASIDSNDPVQIKFKHVQKQIQTLPPLDFIIVDQLIEKQMLQNKKKAKKLQIAHKQAQQAHKQKQKQLFNKNSEMIISKRVQKVQDKVSEFKNLIIKLGTGQFTDQQFPHNETVLGDKLSVRVSQWRKPKIQQKFINGVGMSQDDVKQGQIGDCYLISSFAVLGQKFLKKAIGYTDQTMQLWKNQKGAYMVKFFKFSRDVYVIIDDYMPVDSKGKWVFASSEDPLQFWPGILEKAYAKLYGGYHKIVSGKCHQVLSQFSGGFPFQLLLKDYKSNLNALWARMLNSNKNGYLMAAGSPQNDQGDSAVSKRGIVQGHAYSILHVKQVKKDKLIKLKNPHGSAGRQWTGPFSDDSQNMTKKLRQQLEHQKKNDGIFWMKLEDFVAQFKSLYICCIFEDGWKKFDVIEGQWIASGDKANSYGRPQKHSNSFNNVQYGITVHSKCTLFISLSQTPKTALEGQNYISLRVQANEGKRIKKTDVSSEKLCGAPTKPTDLTTISQQIELQSGQYPYTFTIYIASQKQDNKGPGEGEFKLQLYCNDTSAILIKDEQFDK